MSKQGLTFIELLVAGAIALLLLTGIAISLNAGGAEQAVRREAQLFAYDIRRAQNVAQTAQEYKDVVPYGYGIELTLADSDSIMFFADLLDAVAGNTMRFDHISEEVTRRFLKQRVRVSALEVFSCNSSPPGIPGNCQVGPGFGNWIAAGGGKATLYFCPPNPNTFLYDGTSVRDGNCTRGSGEPYPAIRITLARGSAEERVVLYASGAIVFE